MAMRPSVRDRVLDAADALFFDAGIRPTPIDAVIALAGVSSATLYREYRSKEELVAAALRRRLERWLETWDAAVERADGDEARLLAVFDALDAFHARGARWCAFLGTAAEYAAADDSLRAAIDADTESMRSRLRALAEPVVGSERVGSERAGAADALAEQLQLIVSGHLAMRLRGATGSAGGAARAAAAACIVQART